MTMGTLQPGFMRGSAAASSSVTKTSSTSRRMRWAPACVFPIRVRSTAWTMVPSSSHTIIGSDVAW
jgi:hypothetical protein